MDEQPSGPIKLTWRRGQPAPQVMGSPRGAAAVHGSTAYFSIFYTVYSYTVPENKWTKLPQCKCVDFAMAVINDALTTIGGLDRKRGATNNLHSASGSSWEEVLPPMPTKRELPAAANTPTHLVVAGGSRSIYGRDPLATVEVLNTETLQWFTASSFPQVLPSPQMTTCGGCIYLASSDNEVFSCSVEDLLKSTNSSDCSVWARLASIPASRMSTLATRKGRVLAIGGKDDSNPTGAIHCYDVTTNSWSVISKMPTPRCDVLTAVLLPSDELVVVGGTGTNYKLLATTEIATSEMAISVQLISTLQALP